MGECYHSRDSRHLAQLNIAFMREPAESPAMADFFANIERINALAEGASGFVWRLKGDPPVNPFGANALVNLSVWCSVEALSDFVHKSGHMDIMRRRREWFTRQPAPTTVLWWVTPGHEPGVLEAADRLEVLRNRGPSADAFTFNTHHLMPA